MTLLCPYVVLSFLYRILQLALLDVEESDFSKPEQNSYVVPAWAGRRLPRVLVVGYR